MLREIEAATDGVTFDHFSLLDPERLRNQVEVALDFELSNTAMLDGYRFESEVDAAIAGAGAGGVWLLADGTWNDAGVWDDTAVWNDGNTLTLNDHVLKLNDQPLTLG